MNRPHPTLIIIADDLTGAADTAARCWNAGLPATIWLGSTPGVASSGALAIATDTRRLPPNEAKCRVQALAGALVEAGLAPAQTTTWYKKIDSTLRGNIGAEIEGLLSAIDQTPSPCAVISPAFPAQRRGLEDGYLVHEDTLPRSVHLPEILRRQTGLPVSLLPLAQVRAGKDRLAQQMARQSTSGSRLLVVDGMSEDDLNTIVAAASIAVTNPLFCGSAGLGEAIARRLATSLSQQPHVARSSPPPAASSPIVAVVGSGSPMAHRQIRAVRRQTETCVIEVGASQDISTCLEELALQQSDRQTSNWLLHLPKPPPDLELEGAKARRMVATLSAAALELLRSITPGKLILVGGDTATDLLARLDIKQLTVRTELLPGIPLCTALMPSGAELKVVLKSGNHGEPNTLVRLLDQKQGQH